MDPRQVGATLRAAPRPPTGPRRRAAFGATLALAMGAGTLPIYGLTALAPIVVDELGLSRTQLGSLATLAFVVAAACSVTGGKVIDRIGGRRVLMALFAVAGGAVLAVAVAPSYAWVLVGVGVSGLAQSLSNPVTNQLIAVHVPTGQRGLLMGTKQSGVQMVQFGVGAALPTLALAVGWRPAVGATLSILVVGLVLTAAVIPPGTGHGRSGNDAGEHRREPLPRAVWSLTGYSVLMGAALQATNVHLPLYAFEQVDLSAVVAGGTTGVMGGVGLVARIGWGRMMEHVHRPHRTLAWIASAAALAASSLFIAHGGGQAFLWVGITVYAATALAANVVIMMALVDVVPARQVGRASGVLAVGMYIGFAAGPISFGVLADATGGYSAGWVVLVMIYVAAAVLARTWPTAARRDRPTGDGTPDTDDKARAAHG